MSASEELPAYQFLPVCQRIRPDQRANVEYQLVLRQQPKQSRMCGVGEKADRRPIDPPPIVQLIVKAGRSHANFTPFLQNPYYFMHASLVEKDTSEDVLLLKDTRSKEDMHLFKDNRTKATTGSSVSSLFPLKDIEDSNGAESGFFVFPDLSVRMEGVYRLKFSLYEIVNNDVRFCASIISDPLIVYSAKKFPGMEESTMLSQYFADQGLKIRIRKEVRPKKRTRLEVHTQQQEQDPHSEEESVPDSTPDSPVTAKRIGPRIPQGDSRVSREGAARRLISNSTSASSSDMTSRVFSGVRRVSESNLPTTRLSAHRSSVDSGQTQPRQYRYPKPIVGRLLAKKIAVPIDISGIGSSESISNQPGDTRARPGRRDLSPPRDSNAYNDDVAGPMEDVTSTTTTARALSSLHFGVTNVDRHSITGPRYADGRAGENGNGVDRSKSMSHSASGHPAEHLPAYDDPSRRRSELDPWYPSHYPPNSQHFQGREIHHTSSYLSDSRPTSWPSHAHEDYDHPYQNEREVAPPEGWNLYESSRSTVAARRSPIGHEPLMTSIPQDESAAARQEVYIHRYHQPPPVHHVAQPPPTVYRDPSFQPYPYYQYQHRPSLPITSTASSYSGPPPLSIQYSSASQHLDRYPPVSSQPLDPRYAPHQGSSHSLHLHGPNPGNPSGQDSYNFLTGQKLNSAASSRGGVVSPVPSSTANRDRSPSSSSSGVHQPSSPDSATSTPVRMESASRQGATQSASLDARNGKDVGDRERSLAFQEAGGDYGYGVGLSSRTPGSGMMEGEMRGLGSPKSLRPQDATTAMSGGQVLPVHHHHHHYYHHVYEPLPLLNPYRHLQEHFREPTHYAGTHGPAAPLVPPIIPSSSTAGSHLAGHGYAALSGHKHYSADRASDG